MRLETCDTIVFSDLHAQAVRSEPVFKYYGEDVRKISAGDAIDGEDTKALLELFGEYNVLHVKGNHEIVTEAVMQEVDEDNRAFWQSRWRHNDSRYHQYERHMLRSYGIDEKLRNPEAAEELKEKMKQIGHLSLLNQAKLYYETDDYIIIHGGLTDEPWEEQRSQIDKASIQIMLGNYSEVPNQTMDENFKLSNSNYVTATDKKLITGHTHLDRTAERMSDNGRRIKLASKLAIGAPLYVWQSWDNKIVTF